MIYIRYWYTFADDDPELRLNPNLGLWRCGFTNDKMIKLKLNKQPRLKYSGLHRVDDELVFNTYVRTFLRL